MPYCRLRVIEVIICFKKFKNTIENNTTKYLYILKDHSVNGLTSICQLTAFMLQTSCGLMNFQLPSAHFHF